MATTAEEHRERSRAANRRHYARNREEINAKQRSWYAQNIDSQRERQRGRKRDPERDRDWNWIARLREVHGLLPEGWAAIWQAQDGRCYLCSRQLESGYRVHVDHDHEHCPKNKSCTVCRRGLACFDCNIAIGHAGDDPARLRRMADALKAAQIAVDRRIAESGEQAALFAI